MFKPSLSISRHGIGWFVWNLHYILYHQTAVFCSFKTAIYCSSNLLNLLRFVRSPKFSNSIRLFLLVANIFVWTAINNRKTLYWKVNHFDQFVTCKIFLRCWQKCWHSTFDFFFPKSLTKNNRLETCVIESIKLKFVAKKFF